MNCFRSVHLPARLFVCLQTLTMTVSLFVCLFFICTRPCVLYLVYMYTSLAEAVVYDINVDHHVILVLSETSKDPGVSTVSHKHI